MPMFTKLKEPLNSKRLRVINSQVKDLHSDVSNLSESLIDRDYHGSLEYIQGIKIKVNLLKDQVINGHILKPYKHR